MRLARRRGDCGWATGLVSVGFVGADGTISACVQNDDGNVRIIDPSSSKKDLASCKKDETSVTLNTPPVFTHVHSSNVDVASGSSGTAMALCPAGSSAVGGGFLVVGGFGDVQVSAFDAGTTSAGIDGWDVTMFNPENGTLTFRATAMCVNQMIGA